MTIQLVTAAFVFLLTVGTLAVAVGSYSMGEYKHTKDTFGETCCIIGLVMNAAAGLLVLLPV